MSGSFEDVGAYMGYDESQRFESAFTSSPEQHSFSMPATDDGDLVNNGSSSYVNIEEHESIPETPPTMASYGFNTDDYGQGDGGIASAGNGNGSFYAAAGDGPILPPPEDMLEEGFLLREWRRQNAILLEEKERAEKENLHIILEEAETFKQEFYNKRKTLCETSKNNNREKEKIYLKNQEKFHAEADKQYWKAVAELIPHELPSIETKRAAKDKDKDKKRPAIVVNQGPKPGKPTDLSRMRQILLKLKHNPPPHMKPPPPPPKEGAKEGAKEGSKDGAKEGSKDASPNSTKASSSTDSPSGAPSASATAATSVQAVKAA